MTDLGLNLLFNTSRRPAWEKVNGRKFALVEYRDKKGELRPCYQLTKTECLYIASTLQATTSSTRTWSLTLDEGCYETHADIPAGKERKVLR